MVTANNFSLRPMANPVNVPKIRGGRSLIDMKMEGGVCKIKCALTLKEDVADRRAWPIRSRDRKLIHEAPLYEVSTRFMSSRRTPHYS